MMEMRAGEYRQGGKAAPSHVTLSQTGLRLTVFLVFISTGRGYECGGFIGVDSSSTGTLQSPGYPGNYPNYARCIWMLEAPQQHVVRLSVDFQGETYAGSCSDYVVFRDGGPDGSPIETTCANITAHSVQSTGRWMYVFFTSDGINQARGLSATYTAVNVGSSVNSSISDPIISCRSFEFTCATKLCISRSWRCDGYYDCGCGHNCDEDGCGGLPINEPERLAIGFSIGIVVFLGAAAFGRLLEKQHNWEKEVGEDDAQQPRRQGWSSSKKNQKTMATTAPTPTKPPSPRIASLSVKVSDLA